MPRCLPMLTSFFNWFLIDFYSQLRPPESQESSPRCSESTIFQKIVFRTWHRFLIDCGANLASFSVPKSIKIVPKIDFKMHQIFDWFLHRFFDHFSSILGPKLGPQDDPKTAQDAPKIAQKPQEHPKSKLNRFFVRPREGTPSHSPMGYPPLASIFNVQLASSNILFERYLFFF